MLDEYSIEQRATQIFDSRSRDYFSEVLSCYSSGSYRSAVVMLWSVVVCDFLFKLKYLEELYEDEKARKILENIEKLQKENERSSAWESQLVESFAKDIKLLNMAERENLMNLQKQRHLAAHPIIDANLMLHRPNRDTTRALIRNALDGVLTKAPILTKAIVQALMEDLEKASGILLENDKLKRYLESKYFSRFNKITETEVFKSLWKFVFKLIDEKCESNREINYNALILLYNKNPTQFTSQIEFDKDYYSSIATDGKPIQYLIKFLSKSPEIYEYLADHAKTKIEHEAEHDQSSRFLAWFIHGSLDNHANHLKKWIDENYYVEIDATTWNGLLGLSEYPEWPRHVIRIGNSYYGASSSYNTADKRFSEVIRPKLDQYDIDDCVDLIEKSEKNNQTYSRGRAANDHKQVIDRATEVSPGFDYTKYENFIKEIKQ